MLIVLFVSFVTGCQLHVVPVSMNVLFTLVHSASGDEDDKCEQPVLVGC